MYFRWKFTSQAILDAILMALVAFYESMKYITLICDVALRFVYVMVVPSGKFVHFLAQSTFFRALLNSYTNRQQIYNLKMLNEKSKVMANKHKKTRENTRNKEQVCIVRVTVGHTFFSAIVLIAFYLSNRSQADLVLFFF